MALNPQLWINKFLDSYAKGVLYNDSPIVGIEFERPTSLPVFRIIGVHHLTGAENRGNHNVYLDVVNKEGVRIRTVRIKWGWSGMRDNQAPSPVILDKVISEASGNISMHSGQIVWAQVLGPYASDKVSGIHTLLAGDPKSGNYMGHNSHYVVWLLETEPVVPPTTPTPDPTPTPEPPDLDCAKAKDALAQIRKILEGK